MTITWNCRLFALVLVSVSAQASAVFAITDTTGDVSSNISTSNSHDEFSFDFASLSGWQPGGTITSVTVTETFSNLILFPTFGSTILQNGNETSAPEAFILFPGELVATTKTVTLTPGVGGFTQSDLDPTGTLGIFNIRVSRYNSGSFHIGSVEVQITEATPEPAAVGLMSAGLAGLILLARKRRRTRGHTAPQASA